MSDDAKAAAIRTLERLRIEARTSVLAAGLFSPEFQKWHAEVLDTLRRWFKADDIVYADFLRILFEWPREQLEEMIRSHPRFVPDPGPSEDQWFAEAQSRRFEKALETVDEVLLTAIVDLRNRS